MQRTPAASCGGGVGNSLVSGGSSREAGRTDSSFLPSNFPPNSRRSQQLTPYKLKCDREPLSCRFGPPDFYPQTPNCPEEALNKEVLQSGYRETVDGLEECRDISATYVGHLAKPTILHCKESIRRRLRAINESRALKRKAGQVYGVPLSGSLLTKPGVFPEQRSCGEDSRRKWLESLSQQHKRLRSLSDHVPLVSRRRSLFEVIIKHNVPILRATWFIKVTYLNQVRLVNSGVSSGVADRPRQTHSEPWTKDVIDYLQYLLDELLQNGYHQSMPHGRDRSPQTLLGGFVQQKGIESMQVTPDGEEPSLYFKWLYMVRIVRWHYSEGLLLPSRIVEWVLHQLQEKESFEALRLLLPIAYDLIECIALSQSYVRMFGDIAVRFLQEYSANGLSITRDSQKACIASMLVELLRYLILTVPDTFVSLDYFPLPSCVYPDLKGFGSSQDIGSNTEKVQYGARDCEIKKDNTYHQYLSFDNAVSSVQKRAADLAKAASSFHCHGEARIAETLDKALMEGDVRGAYNFLFENLSIEGVAEGWIAEVSPCLRSCLKWIGCTSVPEICACFFLFEWATCDFRDCRSYLPSDVKFTGTRDFSQIYFAVSILQLKMEDIKGSLQLKSENVLDNGIAEKKLKLLESHSSRTKLTHFATRKIDSKFSGISKISDVFVSPGPLHDIVVSWLDQHEVRKGQGAKRVQVLIMKLIRHGIFCPQAYVRQLIVSGIMDRSLTSVYADKQKRHTRLLKQLPAPYLIYALKEAKIAEMSILAETISIYSSERRLILQGLLTGVPRNSKTGDVAFNLFQSHHKNSSTNVKDGMMAMPFDLWANSQAMQSSSASLSRHTGRDKVQELKEVISALLHLPDFCITFMDKIHNIHTGSESSYTRYLGSVHTKNDVEEVTPGCEECRKLKRQKLNEDRSPQQVHGISSYVSDDEDMWWARKGTKLTELNKMDQPLKSTKQSFRGRQKIVRRTQSLAQLAAARIEGSQGASSSHVCDHRISCLHHRNGIENEFSREGTSNNHACDILMLGKTLKQLCLLERWAITSWLTSVVRELIDGGEKVGSKFDFGAASFSSTSSDKSATRWKLTEDELSNILYLLDVSFDLISVVKLLLWLLPRASPGSNSAFYGGRSASVLSKNKGASCELGEGFLLACLQRYENVLVAANLLPEALSVAIQRAITPMPSNGRISSSPSFVYARSLLKKYGSLSTVSKWEKDFKVTCDQKLLSELEAGDLGYAVVGLPAGVEDFDDYFRQKVSGRLSRVGTGMKDMVQRHMGDVVNYVYGKERRLFASGPARGSETEKWDDLYQTTQHIVSSLMDCIRQSTGAAQDGDPAPVAAAVSALVGSVGISAVNILEAACTNNPGSPSAISSFPLNCVRRIIQVHISCLCLLRDALGDRHGRVFEAALATEASNAVAESLAGKASRSQFHLSSETADNNSNLSNEMNSSTKTFLGRPTKVVAVVSALLVGLVVHGVISLERLVIVLKIKDRLDFLQFIKNLKTGSNGISRSMGAFKVDISIEICLHWFRLLVGNCRTVLDGLVADFLGEPSILALSRMQRLLPLKLVFPPAYSIFAMVIWRPYIFSSSITTRDDVLLYQSLSLAIGDAIKHLPFRDSCLKDTHALYALLASDASDSEFAAMLELQTLDKQLMTMAFVPLRARLFLNAILDCKMPQITNLQDGGSWSHGYESKIHAENEVNQLVHVLDTLQPAKFHWQWIELRLLLSEQVLIEKIESYNLSLAEAIRCLAPNSDNCSRSENENNFTEIVLTRLLVRPDAASLYSEVIHLLGKSLEESLLMNAKWFLAGNDVLLGRKSIRQRLKSIAENRKLSTKVQFWRPWGWLNPNDESAGGDKRKLEAASLEEGEVVDEGMDAKKPTIQGFRGPHLESFHLSQKFTTERALAELMLPCLDRSSTEFQNSFAIDLIKQMNTIEQQIALLSRGTGKQATGSTSGAEGGGNKGSARKGIKGGSPGLGRRSAGAIDNSPVSAASLRASMHLRMRFLLRLFHIIYVDREPSNRNMRNMLASVLLRLSGTRIVNEDADFYFTNSQKIFLLKREMESSEPSIGTSVVLTSDSLFDCFLHVLHGLLSSYKPSWLNPKPASKISPKSPRDVSAFDHEVAETMQSELDNMQLPPAVRLRLQAAMPMLPPSLPGLISSQPSIISASACVPLHTTSISGIPPANAAPPRNQVSGFRSVVSSITGKSKVPPSMQDAEMEIDTWTLLEDGTGCAPTTGNSNVGIGGDNSNLKACSWLRGAVRVRRTDLTYVGAVDDDT